MRHRVEAVARGDGEAREGLLVTVLRPSDQLGIHARSAIAASDQLGHSQGMGTVGAKATQSSARSPMRYPTWTRRTMSRYALFAPTQV